MYLSQKLAIKYLIAAFTLFGVMIVAGLLAAAYYIQPSLLFDTLNFNTAKILHIDTLVVWNLMGFFGAVYWFLPEEVEREVVGIKFANLMFYVFLLAFAIVAGVFIFVQYGKGDEFSLWFINQGRKYVEAPRWAALGILAIVATFMFNIIATAIKARKMTGILGVLIVDLIPLFVLYLDAFPATTNMSKDMYWWWWLVHLWVEATWEVLIACIMAWALMRLLNTPRRIVETWLYVTIALVMGSGILGLGHHYYWIGTPKYWFDLGGFFSALEPLPLIGMVVHSVYDAGVHRMECKNRPALYWMFAEAFGNFFGAGVFGFMMTLPQINLFTHGTQWTVSHGHFAWWGAYVCGLISIFYVVLAQMRGAKRVNGPLWKWAFALLNIGMIGMVGGLLIAGMAQAFYERALGGSTMQAFINAQSSSWFVEGMYVRLGFGIMFAIGYLLLIYDLAMVGKRTDTESTAAEAVPTRLAGAGS